LPWPTAMKGCYHQVFQILSLFLRNSLSPISGGILKAEGDNAPLSQVYLQLQLLNLRKLSQIQDATPQVNTHRKKNLTIPRTSPVINK
jgi:hypothetical protein